MKRVALALAVVSLLSVAACGDDGDQLSEEEYLAQANEICAESNAELEELEIPSTPEEVDVFLVSFREILHDQFDRIRDLNGPGDLEADVNAVIDDVETLIDSFTGEEFFVLVEEDPFVDVDRRGEELGLTVCAES